MDGRPRLFDANAQRQRHAAEKLKKEAAQFKPKFGRDPTPFDTYMVHQRGLAGYEQHLKSPDALAWIALYNTEEGRQKGASDEGNWFDTIAVNARQEWNDRATGQPRNGFRLRGPRRRT
jgi:hypothetical protein